MPTPENTQQLAEFFENLVKSHSDKGISSNQPETEIPHKHTLAILNEEWSEAESFMEKKSVFVRATGFKMDRFDRRLELLQTGKPIGVIIGSFRFKDGIDALIDEFATSDINIPMPPKGRVRVTRGDFPYLEGDSLQIPAEVIEDWYVQYLQAADFAYIENPEGYIGEMSTIEIGLAMCKGVPLYSSHPINLDIIPESIPWKNSIALIKSVAASKVTGMAMANQYDTDDYPWFRPWNIAHTRRPAPDLDIMMEKEGILFPNI